MPAPLFLQSHVLPAFVCKVEGSQATGLTEAGLARWLKCHFKRFDKSLLHRMFVEADFKGWGELSVPHLVAAIDGRFPKRKHNRDWHELFALILDMSSSELAAAVAAASRPATAACTERFVAPGQRGQGRASSPTAARCSSARPTAQGAVSWCQESVAARPHTATPCASRPLGVDSCGSALQPSPGRCTSPRACADSGDGGQAQGDSANKRAAMFSFDQRDAADGEEARVKQRHTLSARASPAVAAAALAGSSVPQHHPARLHAREAAALTPPPQLFAQARSVPPKLTRAWDAALPPRAINFGPSTLAMMRQRVSAVGRARDFQTLVPSLRCHSKRAFTGEQLDLDAPGATLSSTAPLAPTHVLQGASRLAWSGRSCPTRPDRWDQWVLQGRTTDLARLSGFRTLRGAQECA